MDGGTLEHHGNPGKLRDRIFHVFFKPAFYFSEIFYQILLIVLTSRVFLFK